MNVIQPSTKLVTPILLEVLIRLNKPGLTKFKFELDFNKDCTLGLLAYKLSQAQERHIRALQINNPSLMGLALEFKFDL